MTRIVTTSSILEYVLLRTNKPSTIYLFSLKSVLINAVFCYFVCIVYILFCNVLIELFARIVCLPDGLKRGYFFWKQKSFKTPSKNIIAFAMESL